MKEKVGTQDDVVWVKPSVGTTKLNIDVGMVRNEAASSTLGFKFSYFQSVLELHSWRRRQICNDVRPLPHRLYSCVFTWVRRDANVVGSLIWHNLLHTPPSFTFWNVDSLSPLVEGCFSISKDALKDEGNPWLINCITQEYLVNVGQDSYFNMPSHVWRTNQTRKP